MCSISNDFQNSLALTTADSRLPSWNRITDRAHAPPFGKMGGWKPIKCRLPKAKAKRSMYYCSSNEHIMQSKLSKHLWNNMEKKYYTVGSVLKSNRKNRRNRDKIDITNTHIHD